MQPVKPVVRSLSTPHLHDLVYPTRSIACQKILDLGIEAAPEEACGVLVPGVLGFRVIPLRNRSPHPEDSYVIDPETVRSLRLQPEVWGDVRVWHTHPGGNVGPSPGDLKSKIRGLRYMVVTVPTGEVVEF